MGVRNRQQEFLNRLEQKTLESQFKAEIVQGLNCSPFEAEAVLDVVREVFFPFFHPAKTLLPGQLSVVAVSAEEPAGKPLSECSKKTVTLTLHEGRSDDEKIRQSPREFRRCKIPAVCEEAFLQGALLTREDLAYRVFFCSPRTISRDLNWLRQQDPKKGIPLRGLIHDIGPVMTHREQIVRLHVQGKSVSEICLATRHTARSVGLYLSTFQRAHQLHTRGLEAEEIAYLLHRGPALIQCYLDLIQEFQQSPLLRRQLQSLPPLALGKGEKGGPCS